MIANYKPFIDWDLRLSKEKKVRLGSVTNIVSGYTFPLNLQGGEGVIPFYKVSDMNSSGNEVEMKKSNNYVSVDLAKIQRWNVAPKGTVIFPKIGAAIATNKKRILTQPSLFDNNVMGIICSDKVLPKYLLYLLNAFNITKWASLANPPSISREIVLNEEIPLPSIEYQHKLVEEIEFAEKTIYNTKNLISYYTEKIKDRINWLWRDIND